MSTEISPESESVTRNTLWKTWSQISADNTERERERLLPGQGHLSLI